MTRFLAIAAAVIVASMLAGGTAVAQLQMQEQTLGSPGPPPDTKPTAAECQARAKAKNLRGGKARTYVKNCLKP